MDENKRNIPCVKSFEDFFKKYKIDSYITNEDLDSYVKTSDIVNNLTTGGEDKPLSAETMKDTGWIVPELTSQFTNYDEGESEPVRYRKIGKYVYVWGRVTPTSTIAGSSTSYIIFTLPTGYRPSKIQHFVQQGSGNGIWDLIVSYTGTVQFVKYRFMSATDGNYTNCPAGTFLALNASFLID